MADKKQDFQAIYSEYEPRILRYLTRLVGKVEAEDLTQDVFVKISSQIDSFNGTDGERKLSTWIYKIATNRAIDRIRQLGSQKFKLDSRSLEDLSGEMVSAIKNRAIEDKSHPSPVDSVIENDMNKCIRNVIEKLPKDFSSVIILKDLEGFTNPEIAEVLGISLEAVKTRLHRARTELKEALNKKCDFYYDEKSNLKCDEKSKCK